MKVYAPDRCAALIASNNPKVVYGPPIGGSWVEVPSYFHQITSGNPVNDVIHAQVVDDRGYKYSKVDQHATYLGTVYAYKQRTDVPGTSSNLMNRYVNSCRYVLFNDDVETKTGKRKVYRRSVQPVSYCVSGWGAWGSTQYGSDHYPYLRLTLLTLDDEVKFDNVGRAYAHELVLVSKLGPSATWPNRHIMWERTPDTELAQLFDPILKGLEDIMNTIGHYSTLLEIANDVVNYVDKFLESLDPETLRYTLINHTGYHQLALVAAVCSDDEVVDIRPERAFKLAEPLRFVQKLDPLVFGRAEDSNNYWFNSLTQHALLAACESLPRLSDNSIQNLIELVTFTKALVVDHKVEIPESLSEAWLAYRYTYGTGKVDVSDAIKFVTRRRDLGSLDRMIAAHGTSEKVFKDGTRVLCRCNVEVTPKNVNVFKRIWRALDTYGLSPDFYVIWDMIPYSFMVDWFIPIGDMLSVTDANRSYFSGEFYTFSKLCYSLAYTRELDGKLVKCYTRWAGSVPDSLNSFYWLDPAKTSNKTIAKRILDAGSIFLG